MICWTSGMSHFDCVACCHWTMGYRLYYHVQMPCKLLDSFPLFSCFYFFFLVYFGLCAWTASDTSLRPFDKKKWQTSISAALSSTPKELKSVVCHLISPSLPLYVPLCGLIDHEIIWVEFIPCQFWKDFALLARFVAIAMFTFDKTWFIFCIEQRRFHQVNKRRAPDVRGVINVFGFSTACQCSCL